MVAKILWWNSQKTQGICQVVDEHGVVQKYFLLESQIVQRPQQIRAGYYAKFRDVLAPRRPDLLPVAVNVVVSERAFVEHAGVDALKAGV